MGFKHTGLFPEQAINWNLIRDLIKKSKREIKVFLFLLPSSSEPAYKEVKAPRQTERNEPRLISGKLSPRNIKAELTSKADDKRKGG